MPSGNVIEMVLIFGQCAVQAGTKGIRTSRGTRAVSNVGVRLSAPLIPDAKISTGGSSGTRIVMGRSFTPEQGVVEVALLLKSIVDLIPARNRTRDS